MSSPLCSEEEVVGSTISSATVSNNKKPDECGSSQMTRARFAIYYTCKCN